MIVPPFQTIDWFRKAAIAINYCLSPDILRLKPIEQPSEAVEGMVYYDATSKKLRVYDGALWRDCW